MSRHINPHDIRLSWHGAISVEQSPGRATPWRLPIEDLDLFPPEELRTAASHPSGVRLSFVTDADSLTVYTEPLAEGHTYDLYADGKLAGTFDATAGCTALHFGPLAPGVKALELWLSPRCPFALTGIDLPDGATLEKAHDLRPRWVVYGSSITHCKTAGSASTTWPAVAARAQGLNVTSLGYGGQCHLDPMIARMIRDLPADFISIKLGINVMGAASMNRRTFRPAVIGMIATIREGHPDVPLALCSPIWCHARESTPNAVGMTLAIMREEIAAAVDGFRRRGDRRIYYIDGLRLFGESLAHLLPDGTHPNPEGYCRLGENFAREAFEVEGIHVEPGHG
jgi:hypothetical protein